MRVAPLMLAGLLGAMAAACHKGPLKPAARPTPSTSVRWKGVLMTGDDSIVAFDNARHALRNAWIKRGLAAKDIRELSMAKPEQTRGVLASNATNLASALKSLQVRDGDGCVIHLTSHGAPAGFYLRGDVFLTPAHLDHLLDKYCGKRPTIVFVSACYSGVFNGNVMKAPNRAIFTAARDDRNSFGCGVENVYTYWDACTLDELPAAVSWTDLKTRMSSCISAKEAGTDLRRSYPQASIGKDVAKLPVLGRRRKP